MASNSHSAANVPLTQTVLIINLKVQCQVALVTSLAVIGSVRVVQSTLSLIVTVSIALNVDNIQNTGISYIFPASVSSG